jgi:hypothetical protein
MYNYFQMINIWRTLRSHPTINIPLALCDYRRLDLDKDTHMGEYRGITNSLLGYQISHNAQDALKVVLSESDTIRWNISLQNIRYETRFGAHSAFIKKYVLPKDVEQKNIEVRSLVFYDR